MATTMRPHQRASSTASTSSDKPSLACSPRHSAAPAAAPPNIPPPHAPAAPHTASTSLLSAATSPSTIHPSILQPRVAVVLNVPQLWHPWLFTLRLCSILPASWWGLPSALQLLLALLPASHPVLLVRPALRPSSPTLCDIGLPDATAAATVPYALTEAALATIWCFACGYLSFFFTDCLMSRWLINYTPQATLVRLLSINAVNAYLTLSVLSLTGGFQDSRLLLSGWIGIATTLTVCYHITHQKINIRKETSTSINVFSIASYITMVTLLIHMHSTLADYPTMPIVARARLLWRDTASLLANFKGAIERAEL